MAGHVVTAVVDKLVKKHDPRLSAEFEPAQDIEQEDDFIAICIDGKKSAYGIQCTLFGGGYAALQYVYKSDGELSGVRHFKHSQRLMPVIEDLLANIRIPITN